MRLRHNREGFEEARRAILRSKSIAISGHVNPDGDSLGSLLALGLGLESLGKRVYLPGNDAVPAAYRSLPGAHRIVKARKKRVDLAIAVDCSVKEVLGKNTKIFDNARSTIVIDHHEFGQPFGAIRLIDRKAAAVGELAYVLLKDLDVEITRDIAENLLTSIIIETNLFTLSNIGAFTFRVCADLVETGVDFSVLVDKMYRSITKEAAILSGICLSRCKFLKKGQIVWSVIRRRDFARVKGKDCDIDAVANEMRSIKGAKIAVLFREKNKKALRVSLRSKGGVDIARIAEEYNGGGHFDIAGCYIPNDRKSMRGLLSLTEELIG